MDRIRNRQMYNKMKYFYTGLLASGRISRPPSAPGSI